MYKEIENLYKKEGYYNKKIRIISILCLILYILLLTISIIFKFKWQHILLALIAYIIIMIVLITNILEIKISLNIEKIRQSILENKIKRKNQEINMMKTLLKNKNLYNLETVNQIIEHYRNLSLKIKEKNIWNIIAIIITITTSIYAKENILLSSIIIIVICCTFYFFIIQVLDYIKTLKGEDGIYENLEEIFTEIYAELVNKKEKKTNLIEKILKFILRK